MSLPAKPAAVVLLCGVTGNILFSLMKKPEKMNCMVLKCFNLFNQNKGKKQILP